MLQGGSRSRRVRSAYRPAAALTLASVAVVAAVTILNVRLGGHLVTEHGPIEWLQVVLFAGAGLIGARLAGLERAERRSGAPDVLLGVVFAIFVASEMELPRHFLGKSIKIGRLAREVAAGLPRESLFVLVVAGLVVGLGVYAVRHRAEIISWIWSAIGTSWGRLLLLGAVILVLTAAFERPLNRMMGPHLPRALLEETLELLAALYCFLAMMQRRDPGAPRGRVRLPRTWPRRGAGPGTR